MIFGIEAYLTDEASDWFAELWEKFPVHQQVESTMKLDVRTHYQEIRAAAHLIIQLKNVYPIEFIDIHCSLAADKLEEILAEGIYLNDDIIDLVKEEQKLLRSLITA